MQGTQSDSQMGSKGREFMSMLTNDSVESVLSQIADKHVGVIGDFALDCYWMIDPTAEQVSVETGALTRPVSQQRYAAGAAGNVVANLIDLGCGHVSAFGVVGRDPWGAELLRILETMGADIAGMAEQDQGWSTIAYAKPHVADIEQNRIDFGDFNRIQNATADSLIRNLGDALHQLDAVVINVQAKAGIHSSYFRGALAALHDANPDCIYLVDSRDPAFLYDGCLLKVNDIEAVRCCGIEQPVSAEVSREQAVACIEKLFSERGTAVFVTRGSDGVMVRDRSGLTDVPAVALNGEIDTVGAGDAFLSGAVASLACGESTANAACVGNLAAAVCAGKLRQTGTASPSEILALLAHQ
jgi:rfaE bifunctional protein kinase chain/domain